MGNMVSILFKAGMAVLLACFMSGCERKASNDVMINTIQSSEPPRVRTETATPPLRSVDPAAKATHAPTPSGAEPTAAPETGQGNFDEYIDRIKTSGEDREIHAYTQEIMGFSAEGASMTAVYEGVRLASLTAVFYGEAGKAFKEYAFHNGFIELHEKEVSYSSPISDPDMVISKVGESQYIFSPAGSYEVSPKHDGALGGLLPLPDEEAEKRLEQMRKYVAAFEEALAGAEVDG